MKRYIALLRGINISGKNKIPMTELQKGFVEQLSKNKLVEGDGKYKHQQ